MKTSIRIYGFLYANQPIYLIHLQTFTEMETFNHCMYTAFCIAEVS